MYKKIVLPLVVLLAAWSPLSSFAGSRAKTASGCFTLAETIEVNEEKLVVEPGDKVKLVSVTQKQGSSYIDCWEGAQQVGTQLDTLKDEYISEAVFLSEKPGIYRVTYEIKMTSGKSDTNFTQKTLTIIEVKGTPNATGAEIRNLSITPLTGENGLVSGYLASGYVYILMSDGTSIPYSSVFFVFGVSEAERTIEVEYIENGKTLTFEVVVKR